MKCKLLTDQMQYAGSGVERSPGLHLSDVIREIGQELGMVPKDGENSGWDLPLAGEVGFLWEDVLGSVLGYRAGTRPGEVVVDGIAGSPDGIEWESTGKPILAEYKATWKSVRNGDPSDNWKWMVQVKGYCYMISKAYNLHCNRVRFRVLHINGDYKPPSPKYREWLLTFTKRELQENWDMILNHANRK